MIEIWTVDRFGDNPRPMVFAFPDRSNEGTLLGWQFIDGARAILRAHGYQAFAVIRRP